MELFSCLRAKKKDEEVASDIKRKQVSRVQPQTMQADTDTPYQDYESEKRCENC